MKTAVGFGGVRAASRGVAAVIALMTIMSAIVTGCSRLNSGIEGTSSAPSSVVITGPAGTATTKNPVSYLTLWDPCTLPKSVTQAVGLEDYRRADQLDPWWFCNSKRIGDHSGDMSYGISWSVTTLPFEQVRKNSEFSHVMPTVVGGSHQAFEADTTGVGAGRGRVIAWGTTFGSVTATVSPGGGSAPFDVDPILKKFVKLAYPSIPK